MVDLSAYMYRYETYSYQEGFSLFFNIIADVLVFTLMMLFVSSRIGVRKKDWGTILVGSIMVKTIMVFLYKIIDYLINIDGLFSLNDFIVDKDMLMDKSMLVTYGTLNDFLSRDVSFIMILFFIADIIIEGFIYKKVLQYKKHTGMTVSVICNVVPVVFVIVLLYGIYGVLLLSE